MCVCVCLDVNQGGINCNHHAQRLSNLACTDLLMDPDFTTKTGTCAPRKYFLGQYFQKLEQEQDRQMPSNTTTAFTSGNKHDTYLADVQQHWTLSDHIPPVTQMGESLHSLYPFSPFLTSHFVDSIFKVCKCKLNFCTYCNILHFTALEAKSHKHCCDIACN